MTASKQALTLTAALLLAGCGTLPAPAPDTPPTPRPPVAQTPAPAPTTVLQLADDAHAQDAVIYALGLIGNQYRFGGRDRKSVV